MFKQFLNPLNLPVLLLYLSGRLIVLLPLDTALFFGRVLGYLYYLISHQRRKIVLTNLTACFPELTIKQCTELAKKNFKSLGMMVIETLFAWWAADNKFHGRYHAIGAENLDLALQSGKGVLLLSPHFHSIDLGGRILFMMTGKKTDAMYRRYKNQCLENLVNQARSKYLALGIDKKNIKGVLVNLAHNHLITYLPDQNFDYGYIFVPFFNIPAATTTAITRLTKISGAAVVLSSFARYLENNQYRYKLTFAKPLSNFPSGDNYHDLVKVNQLIEQLVREHPEQYLWTHRRFKTRPEGEPSFY